MIDLKIEKTLDSNKVLVTEKNIINKKRPTRYYVVPGESADGFISGRKSLDNTDKLSLAGYTVLSTLVGLTFFKSFKKPALKLITGFGSGLAAFAGAIAIDSKIDEKANKNLFERTGAEEITNDEEKLKSILNQ